MTHEELRKLAPEIALGTIDGEERAEALRHLATCGECRREVDELTVVADELLMVAPVQEPPAGFESRVLDALGLDAAPMRRRRAHRWFARLAPALAAAAVTAVALVAVYHGDHVTAAQYRATLERADGSAFQASSLRDATGAKAGVAFGYQGRPSWMLVTVDPRHRAQVTSVELVTRDRRSVAVPWFKLGPDGSWGGAIPVRMRDVAAIRLLGDRPGEVLSATLGRWP